jgi:acyl carrier protein
MPEDETQTHLLHPALLDACLQVLGASLPSSEQHIYIPTTMNQVRLYQPVPSQVWSHVRLTAGDYAEAKVLTGDVRLLDESGQVIAEILGIGLQRFGLAAQKTIQQHQNGSSITSEAGAASAAVQGSSEAVVQDNNSELINQVLLTEDPTARLHFLETYLKQRVAKVMKIPVSRLDIDKPLEALGFDSLMAVELKYRVESELAIEVPVRNLVEKPTVAQLASQLLNLMT